MSEIQKGILAARDAFMAGPSLTQERDHAAAAGYANERQRQAVEHKATEIYRSDNIWVAHYEGFRAGLGESAKS